MKNEWKQYSGSQNKKKAIFGIFKDVFSSIYFSAFKFNEKKYKKYSDEGNTSQETINFLFSEQFT